MAEDVTLDWLNDHFNKSDYNTPTEERPSQEQPLQEQAPEEQPAQKEGEPVVEGSVKPIEFFDSLEESFYKTGKLNPLQDDKGEIVPIKTIEDFQELLEKNIEFREQQIREEDEQKILERLIGSKSDAYRFVLENAEKYNDPSELVPLLQSVETLQLFQNLDKDNPEHQEFIVRSALKLQGLSDEMIESEVDDLKDREKLGLRADSLHPFLQQYQERETQALLQQKQQEEQARNQFWNGYLGKLNDDFYASDVLDGMKFTKDHKVAIAQQLFPDENKNDIFLHKTIDDLIEKGDIQRLVKIATIALDDKLFDSYYSNRVANKVANGLQRTIRVQSTPSEPIETSKQSKTEEFGTWGLK